MDSFYIITNMLKDKDLRITNEIRAYIESRGKRCVLCRKDAEGHIIPDTVPDDVECGLVLGGDGTLIRAVRDLGRRNLPLLGINLGTVGYLTDVELKDYPQALDRLFRCDPIVEERMMIQGVFRGGEKDLALNDIVLAREGKIRIVQFHIYVNGTLLNTYLADGVIISTPTGSTGYNLSAGGPVVEPVAQTMVVCPICTHNMRFSSYVLSPEHTLTIELERNGRKPVYLFVDESRGFALKADDRISVRRSKHTVRLVRLSERSFCEIFAQKMLPGGFDDEK